MSDQLLDTLDAVSANANRLVAGVGPDQWDLPTPCSEWNVRQLVNHMAFSMRALGASALREAPTFGPDDDHLGDDPVGAFADHASANGAAWRSADATEGMVEVPAGMPAVGALSANVLDLGIHSWDLATATGQDHGLTGDQVAVIDQCDRQLITDDVRSGGGFGVVLAPSDEQPLTTMLAFVGRRN
jgi:uncharacterized protein (TIGR03086 family)